MSASCGVDLFVPASCLHVPALTSCSNALYLHGSCTAALCGSWWCAEPCLCVAISVGAAMVVAMQRHICAVPSGKTGRASDAVDVLQLTSVWHFEHVGPVCATFGDCMTWYAWRGVACEAHLVQDRHVAWVACTVLVFLKTWGFQHHVGSGWGWGVCPSLDYAVLVTLAAVNRPGLKQRCLVHVYVCICMLILTQATV
jgi:hypothetical protein